MSVFLDNRMRPKSGHEPPPPTRQAANFFLPNFQGTLVRPIGVVWGQKMDLDTILWHLLQN